MQVLLIQDVDNLGYAGDVKKVADGFGRNYLLPRNLAVLATPGALKQAETIRKGAEKRRAHEMADAQAMANQLAGLELLFERRAGETGKLYGSVTSGDIADSIKAKSGLEVDKRKVALPEPIRQLGDQEVTIKLMIDVATTIKVHVLPEGGILERERLTKAEEEKLLAEVGESVEEAGAEAEIEEERPAEAARAEAEVEQPAQEVETEAEAEQPAEEVGTGAEAEA
jgi:large subunit ribosomal protein L9